MKNMNRKLYILLLSKQCTRVPISVQSAYDAWLNHSTSIRFEYWAHVGLDIRTVKKLYYFLCRIKYNKMWQEYVWKCLYSFFNKKNNFTIAGTGWNDLTNKLNCLCNIVHNIRFLLVSLIFYKRTILRHIKKVK